VAKYESSGIPPAKRTSGYFFLSQTDVVTFLLSRIDLLGPSVHRSLADLNLVSPLHPPLAVSASETVLGALRLIRAGSRHPRGGGGGRRAQRSSHLTPRGRGGDPARHGGGVRRRRRRRGNAQAREGMTTGAEWYTAGVEGDTSGVEGAGEAMGTGTGTGSPGIAWGVPGVEAGVGSVSGPVSVEELMRQDEREAVWRRGRLAGDSVGVRPQGIRCGRSCASWQLPL